MNASRSPLMHSNDFELHDFFDDPNFDQFIDFVRGENNNEDPMGCYDANLVDESCVDNTQFGTNPGDNVFGFNGTNNSMVSDLNFMLNSFSSFNNSNGDEYVKGGGDVGGLGEDESFDGDENSSGTTRTTSTTTMSKKTKADRSRTLISERRRRGRMKEKLYALRALVPNITKMDKASIVGDAVLYVQELQMQAKKLKADISGLEASLVGAEKYQDSFDNPKRTQLTRVNNYPVSKKIMQMDVFQVEERGFYLRIVSNKGEGVAVSLYKALESLTGFNVQNSNLATLSERFVLTFTLNVKDCEQSMNLPNLKLWVTGALLNQGFEVMTPLSA